MIATPRSDAAEVRWESRDGDFFEFVDVEIARGIERELTAAQSRIAELEAQLAEERRIRSPEASWAWPQLIRIEKALDGGDRATAAEIGDAVVEKLAQAEIDADAAAQFRDTCRANLLRAYPTVSHEAIDAALTAAWRARR